MRALTIISDMHWRVCVTSTIYHLSACTRARAWNPSISVEMGRGTDVGRARRVALSTDHRQALYIFNYLLLVTEAASEKQTHMHMHSAFQRRVNV